MSTRTVSRKQASAAATSPGQQTSPQAVSLADLRALSISGELEAGDLQVRLPPLPEQSPNYRLRAQQAELLRRAAANRAKWRAMSPEERATKARELSRQSEKDLA